MQHLAEMTWIFEYKQTIFWTIMFLTIVAAGIAAVVEVRRESKAREENEAQKDSSEKDQ